MLTEKNNIDELFKTKLYQMEEDVPDYVWDQISEHLTKNKKKRGMIWFWSAAASVLLLMTFGSGYFLAIQKYEQNQKALSKVLRNKSVQKQVVESTHPIENPNKIKSGVNEQKVATVVPRLYSDKVNTIPTLNHSENKTPLNNITSTDKKLNSPIEINENGNKEKSTLVSYDITTDNTEKKVISQKEIYKEQIEKSVQMKEHSVDTFKVKPQNNDIPSLAVNNKSIPSMQHIDKWFIAGRLTSGFGGSSSSSSSDQQIYTKNMTSDSMVVYHSVGNTLFLNNPSDAMGSFAANNVEPVIHFDRLEKARIVISGGLSFGHFLSKRLGVQLGVFYMKRGCNLNDNLFQSLQYIDVPVTLRYKLLDRRFSVYLSGGVSPSFLIGNKTYLIQPSNGDMDLIGKLSNVNQMNYAAIAGLAVNYRLFKRLSLFAEPSSRYSFRPVVKNYDGKRYPFNFVIYAGLNLSF